MDLKLVKQYSFFEMTPELVNKCGEFSCKDDKDIESFFRNKYDCHSTQNVSRSYCFVDEDKKELVCAFTVTNSALNRDRLTNKTRNKIQRKISYKVQRKEYPAILIGQLVVFDKYRHEKLGDDLMIFIKSLFLKSKRTVSYRIDPLDFHNSSCRFLLVDATNNDKIIEYYKRNKFDFLFENQDEEISHLNSNINPSIFARWFYRLFPNKNPVLQYKETRYMFFDMIVLKNKEDLYEI